MVASWHCQYLRPLHPAPKSSSPISGSTVTPVPLDRVPSSPWGLLGPSCASIPVQSCWGRVCSSPRRSLGCLCLQGMWHPQVGPTCDSKAPAKATVQPSSGIAFCASDALCKLGLFGEREGCPVH